MGHRAQSIEHREIQLAAKRQISKIKGQTTEDSRVTRRGGDTETRRLKTEIRGRRSEVRGQIVDVRVQIEDLGLRNADCGMRVFVEVVEIVEVVEDKW